MNIEKLKNIKNKSSSLSNSKGKKIKSKDKKRDKNLSHKSKEDIRINIKKQNKNINININTKKILKPCLKISKIKINEKKNKINKIFEDNLTLNKIAFIQEKNNLYFNNSLIEAQTTYEIEMDNLYKEKMEKINYINEKYDDEIFELKSEVEEDKGDSNKNKENINDNYININNNNNEDSVKIVYNKFIEDKNNEIEKLNKEYEYKSNIIYKKYMSNFDFDDLEEENMIYRNQIYENIRIKISDAINSINNKNVHFKLETENNNNSKNTTSTEITA